MNVVDLHIHPLVKVIKRFLSASTDVFENIVGVYKDNFSEIQTYSCNEKVLPATTITNLIKQRTDTKNTTALWVNLDKLFKDTGKKNNDIFDELTATTLLIPYNSYYEKDKNDLIVVYPKLTENQFIDADKKFLPQYKKTLAFFTETTIKLMLSREYEVHNLMEDIDKHLKNARDLWAYNKNEQHQTKGKQLAYANYIFGKLNNQYGIQITLSKEAEQIIINFEGELQKIENELITAVKLAVNTLPCPAGSIELDEFSLIGLVRMNIEESLSSPSGKPSNIRKESLTGQFSRTEKQLDRLEAAVKATLEKGQKATGKNVGKHVLPTEISAAAISDSIRLHRERIIMLISREPSRWSLLRYHFRPIQSLFNPDLGGKRGQ